MDAQVSSLRNEQSNSGLPDHLCQGAHHDVLIERRHLKSSHNDRLGRSRRLLAGGSLVLLVMVLFVRSADVFYDFVDWDEASMMAQGWAMTRGEVLYRDLPQIHGVLNMAIFVPFFSIFNAIAAPHAIKAMNLALVLLGAFMIRGIARRWVVNEPSALLAAMIFVFALGMPWAMPS